MTHVIRVCSVLISAALGLVVAAPAFAQNAPQCVVSGSPPAGWGFNSIGYIQIVSGESCLFAVNIGRNIEFEHFAKSSHGTPATARWVFFCLRMAGWI